MIPLLKKIFSIFLKICQYQATLSWKFLSKLQVIANNVNSLITMAYKKNVNSRLIRYKRNLKNMNLIQSRTAMI